MSTKPNKLQHSVFILELATYIYTKEDNLLKIISRTVAKISLPNHLLVL